MSPGRDLLARAIELQPELVALRRHIHQYPELSWSETETQQFLERELTARGFECRRVARTGLLARLPGPRDNSEAAGAGGPAHHGARPRGEADTSATPPAVALRAELDALPITEDTGLPFRSARDGTMHACGHDGHMAMVFGAGLLLKELHPEMAGRFVLLFQPAEEVPPGGAREVIDTGVLRDANVSGIFGLHVDPRFAAGTLLLRRGALMAASDRFRITVIGRGGHGGYPHLAVDPIVMASQIVLGLQTIVARQVEPVEPAVISVGRIEGGTADNVIPGQVLLSGTIRSHNSDVRRFLPEAIERTAGGIASASGGSVKFEYLPGHPGVSNDPRIIDFVERTLVPVLGPGRIRSMEKPIMGGEDFAHYLETLPGAFLRIGVRNEGKGSRHPIHSPKFDLDEDALPVGAAALAAVAAGWHEFNRPGNASP